MVHWICWSLLIKFLSEFQKKNEIPVIQCPKCGEKKCLQKYGSYSRHSLVGNELIKIQRYKCKNINCKCITFSILPYPFLRIYRASLCMLFYVLERFEQGESIQEIANSTEKSWPLIQRWLKQGRRIMQWLKNSASYSQWHGNINRLNADNWYFFIREFSWYFFPARYG